MHVKSLRVKLDYGRTGLEVELPDARVQAVLGLQPAPALENPSAAIAEALAHPIGCAPLSELAAGKQSACLVISDITRPVPNRILLPEVIRVLEAAGVPSDGIFILIATGTHRPSTEAEILEMVGPEIAAGYRVLNHVAGDLETHRYLGETPNGVPIWVDSRYLDAEVKVSLALIEPHFMAGFSGGRKSICPGICAMETVKIWHGPRFIGHELSDSGSVRGNPVHEDSLYVARKSGLQFICDVTLDEQRRLTGVFAGEVEAAGLAGVERARRVAVAPLDSPADVVVTTCAGYPLDLTFYQAVKGMVGALPALKPGGAIVIASECAEGIGNAHFRDILLDSDDLEAFVKRTYEPGFFIPDQWEAHELWKAVKSAEVYVVASGIPAETLSRCFVKPVATVEEGVRQALETRGPDAKLVVIPKGPYVLPQVQ